MAKVNDRQLQAQLQRLVSQLKLAEDRVFRQNALLERDAVSKEAYEQVKTELATLNADIDIVKANIALTELRAPFDGVIGLRQVSVGAYALSLIHILSAEASGRGLMVSVRSGRSTTGIGSPFL